MGDGCFAQEYLVCIEFAFDSNSTNSLDTKSFDSILDIDIDESSLVIVMDKRKLGIKGSLKAYRLGLNFDTMKVLFISNTLFL